VDVFRGICIVLMVLVNNPGDPSHVLTQLHHVAWNGWALADVVAPGFLWVVGILIPISLTNALGRGTERGQLQRRIITRSLLLVVLGFAITLGSSLDFLMHGGTAEDISLLDILQRIGLCYGLAATAYLWFGTKGALWLAAASLTLYLIPLGVEVRYQGLDAAFTHGTDFGSLTDHFILGTRLNSGQGLETLLTGVVTVVTGLLCGVLILRDPQRLPSPRLFVSGVILLALGLLLSQIIPINRYLWTPSFVLVTSGACIMFFFALYLLERWRPYSHIAAPLLSVGRNPIVVYALAALVAGWLGTIGFSSGGEWHSVWTRAYLALLGVLHSPVLASHGVTLVMLAALWLLAHYMNRRRIYVRI
jgi:predicted acyltransferase